MILSILVDTFTSKISFPICNIFEVREDDLENMKLKESANWDSVGHINLISSLEETFDINMEPEDMFEITSYSDGLLVLHNQYNIEF